MQGNGRGVEASRLEPSRSAGKQFCSFASKRDLAPDKALLNGIFPQSEPATTTILSQTYDSCTFIAHIDGTNQIETSHGDVVVRLELSNNRLRTVSALQQVATLAIPELVPAVYQVGTARAEDGREIDFFVSAFVAHSITLETVWDGLTDEEQSKIMNQLLTAMTKLQALNLADEPVRKTLEAGNRVLSNTIGQGSGVLKPDVALGSPEIGIFEDVHGLVAGIIAYNGVSGELKLDSRGNLRDNGVIIATPDEELHIGQAELESLGQQAVLCHNDLEPRNLLVRHVHSDDGSLHYDLTAIIDWEMAGFFPFAYEYSMKDSLLGSSNTCYSWYSLFKQRTAPLLPVEQMPRSRMLFMQAMALIQQLGKHKSKQKKNVGILFREKWIRREQLVLGASLWSGWVRRPDATAIRAYGKEDNRLLEEEVLEELGLS